MRGDCGSNLLPKCRPGECREKREEKLPTVEQHFVDRCPLYKQKPVSVILKVKLPNASLKNSRVNFPSKMRSFRFLEAAQGLEGSVKKTIGDNNPLLISVCGGIEAVFRQGLKSK